MAESRIEEGGDSRLLGGSHRGWTYIYRNELGLLVATVAVICATLCFSPAYWELPGTNAAEIIRQTSLLGVFSLGAAIVIIAGGIDLSSGSVIAFGGSVCALVIHTLVPSDARGLPDTTAIPAYVLALAIGATILAGFLVGTLHTWLITIVGLPPFIATLASLVGLRSFARILNQAVTRKLGNQSIKINIQDPTFGKLGSQWWIPLMIFLVLGALAWLLMSRTVLGRHLYAMGGNEEAARLSGIRTDRLKWFAYCVGAITAALAGILYTAEVGAADPQDLGRGYELNAIAAAVVGGCSLQGGVGLIPGVMIGVLFLRVVIDAIAKVIRAGSDDYEGLIVGFLVVLAVAFNELRQRRSAAGRKRFFPGAVGVLSVFILTALVGAVMAILVGPTFGQSSAVATLVVLGSLAFLERRQTTA
jgi:ribose/xylose/arabinose/galactoside ABC-type transport system permease subunit